MNWLHSLWFEYVYPSLKGNFPEDLLMTLALAILATLIWPPTRRQIELFAQRHVTSIKAHVTAEHAAVHDKLDHLIKHSPEVPPFPTKEDT